MDSKIFRLVAAAAATVLFAGSASAHHGAGAYDTTQTVTVTGKVTEFHFVNPHVLIYAEVMGKDGKAVQWSGELTSPNRLARGGNGVKWSKTILAPGDTIELKGNPARNGAPSLRLMKVAKIVDGQEDVLIDDENAAGSTNYGNGS
jgi:Family of unknown function (DUF6152)